MNVHKLNSSNNIAHRAVHLLGIFIFFIAFIFGISYSYAQNNTQMGNQQCFVFTQNIALGDRGNDVYYLQQRLITLGYLHTDAATGYFGSQTEVAVKNIQKNNGLEVVGNVGPRTRSILNQESCNSNTINNTTGGQVQFIGSSIAIPTKAPKISGFSVKNAEEGDVVLIKGTQFDPYNNVVLFGNVSLNQVTSRDGKTLTIEVPKFSPNCPKKSGSLCLNKDGVEIGKITSNGVNYYVYVTNTVGISNKASFLVVGNTEELDSSNKPSIKTILAPKTVETGEKNRWLIETKQKQGRDTILYADWDEDRNRNTEDFEQLRSISGDISLRLNTINHEYIMQGNYSPVFMLEDRRTGLYSTIRPGTIVVKDTVTIPTATPKISKVVTTNIHPGDEIIILGSGFTEDDNTVIFNNTVIEDIDSYNAGTVLYIEIPEYVDPCAAITSGSCTLNNIPVTSGSYSLVVINDKNKRTNTITVKVN